jgi:hypothetical protein
MSTFMPCWRPEEVLRIVTPDAEEISDHVFGAVHCPTDLQLADTWNGPRHAAPAEHIVEQFLAPGARYVQAVVIGESGTGKSHLIQWLRLNLPRRPEDVVLTIPKVGTSLRGIVERIVRSLPLESRAPFEERLSSAGSHATTHQARIDKFLYSLAWSVQHAVTLQSADDEALAEVLPDVLSDPNFRRNFFSLAGGTVDQIVRHIFDQPEGRDDPGLRRQFQAGDLPLQGAHYRDAAGPTRDAIDYIRGEPGMEQRAIELMTRALEPAIAQTLNFSADDLIDLMCSLRIHLAKNKQRLILLIEDFARLQGIDSALLQALVTPPRQEEDKLCELRWAMAVTTGYWRSRFDETVRTRATFVVDMDRSQPASIPQFTAGYLNAIRVGEAALVECASEQAVPNACDQCARKQACWEAFGNEGGFGLFPFNATALASLAERTGARQDDLFNPRTFLKAVVTPVMKDHHGELSQGQFPSAEFLLRVGGANRLKPQLVAELERTDPVFTKRRMALLELWDGSGQLVNLRSGVHNAFGIPELASTGKQREENEPRGNGDDDRSRTNHPPPPPPLIAAVHQWASDPDSILAQSHVNALRTLVYAAIDGFIDWDALGIQKSVATSAFRGTSINFARQQTARVRAAVAIELPLPGRSIAQTAVALEALVRAADAGDWTFEQGVAQLAMLLDEMRRWADEVAGQLQRLFRGDTQWNPITAAVEVLTMMLLQSGEAKANDSVDVIAAKIFERATTSTMAALTVGFREHNTRLVQSYETIRTLLKALCSGTKGGRVGNFTRMLPVIHAIRALRRRQLALSQQAPVDAAVQDIKPLVDIYTRLQADYLNAFNAEREAWRIWRERVRRELGSTERRPSEFVAAVQELLTAAENAGVDLGAAGAALRTHLAALPRDRLLDQALDHWVQLDEAQGIEALIRCAIASAQKMPLEMLFESSAAMLDRLEGRVSGELGQIDIDVGQGLRASQETIRESLGACVAAFEAVETSQEPT